MDKRESNRSKNREIERKKRNQKLMSRYGFYALAVLLVLGLGWLAADHWSRRWILNIDGNRVATTDLRFLTYMHEGTDFALHMLKTGIVLEEQAERLGVGVTQQELDDARELASMFRGQARDLGFSLNFISVNRKAEIIAREWNLFQHIIDAIAPESDFYDAATAQVAEDFADHLENNRLEFIFPSVYYLMTDNRADAEAARTAAQGGTDFNEVIRTYGFGMEDVEDDFEFSPITLWELADDFRLTPDVTNAIIDLAVGDISEVIDREGWYLVFYVESREELDHEMVELIFMQGGERHEQAVQFLQFERFSNYMEQWMEDLDNRVVVNQRALNRL